MGLFLEQGYTSLNKYGEELCGDRVESCVNNGYTTLVLADGMGSGVKANILSTLTSKILCTMVSNDVDIEDCIETIIQSLPVCKERQVAYSTFSVIHINEQGNGYLIEFDNPQAILMHDGKCVDLPREKMEVCDKEVYRSEIHLKAGDVIIVMSDGTIHAGVGQLLNFGWQRKEIMEYLDGAVTENMSARCIACLLAGACNDLYLSKPGDDTTVAAVKIRNELQMTIMVGPPIDKENDNYYIEQFLSKPGKKIVCGGTTSKIVSRYLNTDVTTSLEFPDKDIPPIGHINGIDLTTEGVLTLRKLLELSEKYLSISDITPKNYMKKDGASLLANLLFEEATHVHFYVGQSINEAHKGLPIDTTMKLKLVDTLSENLKKMGKKVEIEYI